MKLYWLLSLIGCAIFHAAIGTKPYIMATLLSFAVCVLLGPMWRCMKEM